MHLKRQLKKRFSKLKSVNSVKSLEFSKSFFYYIKYNNEEDLSKGIIDYVALYLSRKNATSASINIIGDVYKISYLNR